MQGLTKAQLKKLKKQNQAEKRKGSDFVPEDQYIKQADQETLAKQKRAEAAFADARFKQNVPIECTLAYIETNMPEVYQSLASGPVEVLKTDAIEKIKAVWHLELDRNHTFDTHLPNAAANFGLVKVTFMSGKLQDPRAAPDIMLAYALACNEKRHMPYIYHDRNRFIEMWKSCEQDIHIFSRNKLRSFKSLTAQLEESFGEVLEQIDAEDKAEAHEFNFHELKESLEHVKLQKSTLEELEDREDEFVAAAGTGEQHAKNEGMEHYAFDENEDGWSEQQFRSARETWADLSLELLRLEVELLQLEAPLNYPAIFKRLKMMHDVILEKALRVELSLRGYRQFAPNEDQE